jgi:hypothetical protein
MHTWRLLCGMLFLGLLAGVVSGEDGEDDAALPNSGYAMRTGAGRKELVEKYGGSVATEAAVDRALQWLAYHQEPDGHFDSEKYEADAKADVAVTSLALLSFLGAGHTERVGTYKDNVRRLVQWLIQKQGEDGLLFELTDAPGHRAIGYPTAIATLALCEAAGMCHVPETVAAAQKAINYAQRHQHVKDDQKLGWRYLPNSPGDISVTSWFIAALKAAKLSGLKVEMGAFDGAIKFLDSVATKTDKRIQFSYMPGKDANRRRTMMGIYDRLILGYDIDELRPSIANVVDENVPAWGNNGEQVDLYYWYYGSLCCFQAGGESWKKWNAALAPALMDHQNRKGDNSGSWESVGDFSREWGRAGQTALGALCLEVYYRYRRPKD